jgi:hypothetical protein
LPPPRSRCRYRNRTGSVFSWLMNGDSANWGVPIISIAG